MKNAVCVLYPVDYLRQRHFLGLTRPNSDTMWGLPGGKVEDGETEVDAIIREMREETGIVMSPKDLIEVYTGVSFGDVDYMTTAFVYTGKAAGPLAYRALEDGIDIGYLLKEELIDPEVSPFSEYHKNLFGQFSSLCWADSW